MGTHGAGGSSICSRSVTESAAPGRVPGADSTAAVPRVSRLTRILCRSTSDLSPAIGSLRDRWRGGDAEVTLLHVMEWPADEEPRTTRAFNARNAGNTASRIRRRT
jgi:hypothetical protein